MLGLLVYVKVNAVDQELDSRKGVASVNETDLSAGGSKVPDSDAKPDRDHRVDKVKSKNNGDKGEAGNQVADLGSSGESKGNGRDGKKDEKKSSSNVGTNGDTQVSENGNNAGTTTPFRKGGPWVEECDPSNQCVSEKGKLVGCLRFPGNGRPHLSVAYFLVDVVGLLARERDLCC